MNPENILQIFGKINKKRLQNQTQVSIFIRKTCQNVNYKV
jgi:hypothetical protein